MSAYRQQQTAANVMVSEFEVEKMKK